ncbi:MAG: hypothetical protein ABJ056_17815 [Halioglobus sp.]
MDDTDDIDFRRENRRDNSDAISIVQRGNIKLLEATLRKQWRLGQNIVLCWSPDERGMLVIFVPHYYLGNYCAETDASGEKSHENERFVQQLISGERCKGRDELFDIAKRLRVSPTFVKLNTALTEEPGVVNAVEQLIKRYGLSYVDQRAVLLFDIAQFSLYTPFEQASQLNSLSYSMNSAYNKLLGQGIEINFSRTTTGDGYYVWNRDFTPFASMDLFCFMLLVVADNAAARAVSKGNTVPVIRTGFHIGSHYELYQAEGVNPTVFSYIVGDVTIELARMVDLAKPHQILMGDFKARLPGRDQSDIPRNVDSQGFVQACVRELDSLVGTQLAGKPVQALHCSLSGSGSSADSTPRKIQIVDKHGLSRDAFNLELGITLDGEALSLGLSGDQLPAQGENVVKSESSSVIDRQQPAPARSTDELIDELSGILQKRVGSSSKES